MQRVLLGFCAVLLLQAPVWGAQIYYVNGNAPAGNTCPSAINPTTPVNTINKGAACLQPGDTLIIKDGTYPEHLSNAIPSGLSESQPTVVRAEHARQAILTGPGESGTNSVIRMGERGSADFTPGSGCCAQQNCSEGQIRNYITLDGLVIDLPTDREGQGIQVIGGNECGTYGDIGYGTGIVGGHHFQFLNMEIRGGQNSGRLDTGTVGIAQAGSSHHYTLRNSYLHDLGVVPPPGVDINTQSAWSYGMYISGSDNVFENTEFARISGYPLHGYSASAPGHFNNNIFRNNYVHDTGGPLLFACGGHDNQIYNNIIARTGIGPATQRGAIVLGTTCAGIPANNNLIYHNTIVRTVGSGCERGITLSCTGLVPASNNIVRDNILYLNIPDDTVSNGSPGAGTNIIDHNLSATNPLFVVTIPNSDLAAAGITAASFKLQSGSPAINAGVSVGIATDIGGANRDNTPDDGAWEFGGIITPPTPSLTWPLNEGTGTTTADLSGNGITGTLVNNPVWRPGRVGPKALGFDNISTYLTNGAMIWASASPVTVTFWIKAGGCAGGCGTFYVGFADFPDRFEAHVPWSDNVLYWDYGDSRGPGRISTDFTPYLGKWTFVALVSNGSTLKAIYLNGQLSASGTTADAPHITLTGIDVGRWHNTGGTGQFFANADIDQFQLVNQVLTAQQILDRYRKEAGLSRHRTGN